MILQSISTLCWIVGALIAIATGDMLLSGMVGAASYFNIKTWAKLIRAHKTWMGHYMRAKYPNPFRQNRETEALDFARFVLTDSLNKTLPELTGLDKRGVQRLLRYMTIGAIRRGGGDPEGWSVKLCSNMAAENRGTCERPTAAVVKWGNIRYNEGHVRAGPARDVVVTVLHEVAHALAPIDAEHGERWERIFVALTADVCETELGDARAMLKSARAVTLEGQQWQALADMARREMIHDENIRAIARIKAKIEENRKKNAESP